MILQPTPDSGVFPVLKGILRVAGIVLMALTLMLMQMIVLWSRRGDPLLLPIVFHTLALRIMCFKIRIHGDPVTEKPVLYVANHTSYRDVVVLGSILRAAFIAKAEVKGWPVFGLLSKLQRSAFVERRSIRVGAQRDALTRRLLGGDRLVLFAEGTTSDGQRVLPFKSSLFAAAGLNLADGRPVPVQPMAILCTEIGGLPAGRAWRPYYAWFGDMTLIPHLWRVLTMGRFTVDVTFFPPVTQRDFADRKALADYCHDVIAGGVERVLAGRN